MAWISHAEFSLRLDTSFAAVANLVIFGVLLSASLAESDRLRRLLQIDLDRERAAAELGKSAAEITELYTQQWLADRERTGCRPPEVVCRATDHRRRGALLGRAPPHHTADDRHDERRRHQRDSER